MLTNAKKKVYHLPHFIFLGYKGWVFQNYQNEANFPMKADFSSTRVVIIQSLSGRIGISVSATDVKPKARGPKSGPPLHYMWPAGG